MKIWPKFLLSTSSLRVRLASTILLALLPLGILSVAQTQKAREQVSETTLDGIRGASLQAAQNQIDLIKEAQITARLLAAILANDGNQQATCIDWVSAAAVSMKQATIIAFVPVSGMMTCASNGQSYDFRNNALFQSLIKDPKPATFYNPHGPVSDMAIIAISHPVFAAMNQLRGLVTISLPYQAVAPQNYGDAVALWKPTYQATLNADGTILLSSVSKATLVANLPRGVELAKLRRWVNRPALLYVGREARILSVVNVTDDLFALSIWTRDPGAFWNLANASAPYLLTGLTWIAALMAASFASNRLVVRHVRLLSRSMSDYVTTQSRMHIPDLSDAPTEIRTLRAAYAQLVRTIELEEAEMENLLVDKDTLLREVTHRSGNSLQIIASIMRLYRRDATDHNLQMVLDGLINRVIALSSTHTSLYALSGQSDANLEEILTNVIDRLVDIHDVAIGVTVKHLEPITIEAEVAIPLALALAEAVSCFFTLPNLNDNDVLVLLADMTREIRLSVQGPLVTELLPETHTGIASIPLRMLRQFAAQFGGKIELRQDGRRVVVDVLVPKRRPAQKADA